METWLVALIAAAGAVAGAAVSAIAVYRVARLEVETRDKDELRAALAGYGAALDRLNLKVEQLPHAHGIDENCTTRLVARWRTLDWLMGRLSLVTIGRGGMIALDEMIAATNRLLLVHLMDAGVGSAAFLDQAIEHESLAEDDQIAALV